MKRLSFTSFFILIILSIAFAADSLIDSYSESYYSHTFNVSGATNKGFGQSFTNLSSTYSLKSVKFYLKKTGSPTGSAYAYLYAHTGTYGSSSKPTGTALATSNALDISTLTTSFQLITMTFPEPYYNMSSSTYYCIIFFTNTGDASNYVQIGDDNTTLAHSGNECYTPDGANWNALASYDLIFYVYGELVQTGGGQVIIVSD